MGINSFFLIVVLILLVFVGGIVVLIIYLTKDSTPVHYSSSGGGNVSKNPDQISALIHAVNAERHHLTSWIGHRVTDVRADLHNYRFSKSFGGNEFKGKLTNASSDPILAFKRVENGFKGTGNIAIQSTDNEYFLIYTGAKVSFYYNRKALGEWLVNGIIRDPSGREIGRCTRGDNVTVTIGLISFDTDKPRFPCYLNGRQVAIINRSPRFDEGSSGSLLQFNRNTGTKMIELVSEVTANEEQILMCIILTEMLRNGFSFSGNSGPGGNFFGKF